jgi:membrane protein required for colicin V production
MNTVDLALLIALGGFILYGFWFGLIHMIGSIAGMFIGAFIAGRFYGVTAGWLGSLSTSNPNLANILGFVITFVVVNKLVGLAFWVFDKIYKFFAVIPGMKMSNRLLGAALGFFEAAAVLGLTVYFASRFPFSLPFTDDLATSGTAAKLYKVGEALAPLLPKAVQILKSVL